MTGQPEHLGDDAPYSPPLTLNPALLSQVAAIAEVLGRWSARQDVLPSPLLRRENRIHTIQASLAIEQNSLSLEQVTALFDGERVIGPARDIQEVRNAINAYDAMPSWDPANPQHLLEAHGLLMAGLIDGPGCFRSGGVGIYRGDQLVHMAPPAVAEYLFHDEERLSLGKVLWLEVAALMPRPQHDGSLRMPSGGRAPSASDLARKFPTLPYIAPDAAEVRALRVFEAGGDPVECAKPVQHCFMAEAAGLKV